MAEWWQDEDFWRACAPFLFDDKRRESAVAEVDALLGLAKVAEGAAVLDLCCGPGRHSLELHRRGCRVTGVDLSEEYLEQARAESGDVEWVRCDMREFVREEAFDLAINLYSSFGYFEDPEEDLRVARNLRASLRPNGVLVMELKGTEALMRVFQRQLWYELDDGSVLLVEHEIEGDWDKIRNRWILRRGAERKEFPLELRLYSAPRLAGLLGEAGFKDIEAYGWFDGRPYDDEAERLVVVAR